ncbi:hypothetical protein, conserved [Babesia bigemina]|uniref:C3H1-type domain-containing protein n=1 Tax=Babesia bigemina TaxID=5866 RepID=A0A061BKX4_BABBI|nr:hypothetical protein, conserved [Babesia bigemina]CDR71575.1 hypothetical protein, conserved [Babesia bigemina]|eukprot:XP_012770521.1 hypothetical protein, conserved [Babesia bigemina]
MDKLKHDIEALRHNITKINENISLAEKAMNSVISQIQTVLQDARGSSNRAMQDLKLDLQKRAKDAFNDLQDGVQTLFANQKKAELKALQETVSTQIPIIQKLMDDDANAGLKGLMKKLHKRFQASTFNGLTHLTLQSLANRFNEFFRDYFNDLQSQPDLSPSRLIPLTDALYALLSTMNTQRHFDATVSRKLADLQTQLDTLAPSGFAEASPLLNVVKRGVQAFHGELAKQYVSRYSGQNYAGQLVKEKTSPDTKAPKLLANPADNTEITEYGRKCAKVFLTSLATLSNDFKHLSDSCKESRFNQIHTSYNKYNNKLGDLFSSCGYQVSMYRDSHEGELRNKPDFTGTDIHAIIHKKIFNVSSIDLLKQWMTKKNKASSVASIDADNMSLLDILQFLYDCLENYYCVSHLRHIERPKSPSSVYQMLCWLTGLPHNRVFPTVSVSDIGDLFEKPDEASGDSNPDGPLVLQTDPDTLPAYPEKIAASTLTSIIHKVCVDAEDVLIGILGHGHADGIYAVDFNTNPDGFAYPTAPGACFDMLCDVLNRLYLQLFFLYGQCSNEEPSVSWRDCWYGNQVGGSAWNCNAMQCPNQKGNQIHKQRCNQKCDQTAQCGIKSPLQSFLEDGLPGFLPHSFTKPGCKLTCTLSNHRGIPCRTPMGFNDISVTASHRQRGEYLKKALEGFCGSDSAPLTKLCAQLTCLLQKPPQTLGDIFAFYYGYLGGWAADFYGNFGKSNPHTQAAFKQAVNDAYFGEQYGHLDPTSLVSSSKHGDEHSKGNLCSIANCESGSVAPCGLYVKSMTQDITRYYSAEHKANHLSWIVYITETFCDLLKKLYDDCCKKCGPGGSKCHVKSCAEQCEIKYSDDKQKMKLLKDKSHKLECKSIVTCRDTHPTLYRYGFTFGHPWGLNGSGNNERAKRTCKDFCEALKKMLAEGSVLITLRGRIDDFLWATRFNFSITVLALWLLSLLYLTHIMVIRLDLLHIKSHLHSPSSHRIAAQSLLAAARVNKLNKVFYLQP